MGEQICIQTEVFSRMGRIGIQRKRIASFPNVVSVVDDVAVAVLTGGRPGLLARTLDALEREGRDRFHRWKVLVLVNGADQATLDVLRTRVGLDVIPLPGPVRPIGESVSVLMDRVRQAGRRFVLHLEDDWCCVGSPDTWLDRAAHALQDPTVGQVRLRRSTEKVMRTNMLTGQAIRWGEAADHQRSSNAHFTFNPHLIRAEHLSVIYPCQGELDAQRKFGSLGKSVVQLIPGAFYHVGGQDSLRQRLGHGHGP